MTPRMRANSGSVRLEIGAIVEIGRASSAPRPADRNIAELSKETGEYRPSEHRAIAEAGHVRVPGGDYDGRHTWRRYLLAIRPQARARDLGDSFKAHAAMLPPDARGIRSEMDPMKLPGPLQITATTCIPAAIKMQRKAGNCRTHTCASVDDTTPMNFFDVAAFGRCGHLSGRVLPVVRNRMALMVVR